VSYRVLVLPPQDTLRPELLHKIRDLVEGGATVSGPAPSRSPSLENYPRCDTEVRKLVPEGWSGLEASGSGARPYGKGRFVWGSSLGEVLASLEVHPDFHSTTPLRFTHRRDGDTDIYFVANPKAQATTAIARFRAGNRTPQLWWPDGGRIERAAVYAVTNGVVRMPLSLGPHGSVFVVFRESAAPPSQQVVTVTHNGEEVFNTKEAAWAEPRPPLARPDRIKPVLAMDPQGRIAITVAEGGQYELEFANGGVRTLDVPPLPPTRELSGPWEVRFTPGWGVPAQVTFDRLVSWTDRPEDSLRHYSGKAAYTKAFDVPESAVTHPQSAIWLDLGDACDMATVRVNGREFTPLWIAPWRVDITSALKPGRNELEVEVVNVWNNRLVADAAVAPGDRRTTILAETVRQGSPLLPAGLLGPVTLYHTRQISIP
jgi:hypothetical protein